MDGVDAGIADLAARQYGVLSRHQASAIGLTASALRWRVAQGRLEPLLPGVLLGAGAPPSWHRSLMASCLAGGDGTAVSHRAAAALHELDGFELEVLEVSAQRTRSFAPREVTVHRSRCLEPVDVTSRSGIPVTTPARTLIDLGAVVSGGDVEHAFDSARRDGLVRVPFLRWRFAELGRAGTPGTATLRRLLDEPARGAPPASVLERRLLRILAKARVPAPRCQHVIREQGRVVARADFAWPEARLIVEADGHGSHSLRRQRQRDGERANDLVSLGWTVLRFTWEDVVERPDHVSAVVRKALARAGSGALSDA